VATEAAAQEIGRRMQAVMDAIARCEGDPEACADPQANPSLARAAEAARAAGAPDDLILEAVALAHAGESAWEIALPAAAETGVRLVVAGPADASLAAAVWATGTIVLAPSRGEAEQIAATIHGARGGVDLKATEPASSAWRASATGWWRTASTMTATRPVRPRASSTSPPAGPSPGPALRWRCSATPSLNCAWAAGGWRASPGPAP
jgi:hypothetical protein